MDSIQEFRFNSRLSIQFKKYDSIYFHIAAVMPAYSAAVRPASHAAVPHICSPAFMQRGSFFCMQRCSTSCMAAVPPAMLQYCHLHGRYRLFKSISSWQSGTLIYVEKCLWNLQNWPCIQFVIIFRILLIIISIL